MLRDSAGAVPMEAPMMIWEDEIDLGWSDEERAGRADAEQPADVRAHVQLSAAAPSL